MDVTGIIFAVVDTDAAAIESWNRWYDLEHLPPNIALPGILSGRRYVAHPRLVEARRPERPLTGFEDGRGLHLTIYLTCDDPVEVIAAMTSRRDELEAAGRMERAGNRVVRAGDAMRLAWTQADPALLLDGQDVPHVGHTGIRVVLRRGGGDQSRQGAGAALGIAGVHGVASYRAVFMEGVDCDIYLLEGDSAQLTEQLRHLAPPGEDAEILLDAPFDIIVPFDYSFAQQIRDSSLPDTID